MRDHYKIFDQQHIHFLTSTITEWLPVFTCKVFFEIIIDSLKFCMKEKSLRLYAYVIMENHFHLIASSDHLSETIASLRKYTSKKIIETLESEQKMWLLNQLAFYKKRHKKKSQYQVWQEGCHPIDLQSPELFYQKAEYIHYNPVERGYVDLPEHWRYSSARNYLLEDQSIINVDCSLR